MQAECAICMERFESNEAISASECGHVFHTACITQWLDKSAMPWSGQCPQCRSTVDRNYLVRLYFNESSTFSHELDDLHDQLDFANDRIDELSDECARREAAEFDLRERLDSLNASYEQRGEWLDRQSSHIEQLTKQQALCEQKLSAQESQLNGRQVEKLRLERACTGYKSQLDQAKLQIEHLELKRERNEALVARYERLISSNNGGQYGQHCVDTTRTNEQFEARMFQLAVRIDDIDTKCVNRINKMDELDRVCAKLERTTLASDDKRGVPSTSTAHAHYEYETTTKTNSNARSFKHCCSMCPPRKLGYK